MPCILAIESSCDESSLAIVQDGVVRVQLTASQDTLHQQYDGVVPELASREHVQALPFLYRQLQSSHSSLVAGAEGIGVTAGPGLKGCLMVGLGFAKGLAVARQLPLIAVNHIAGHVFSPWVRSSSTSGANSTEPLEFPFLSLVVSGGHTELLLVKDFLEVEVLTRTSDDAAGEAFDKAAALLNLPYPGGRIIAQNAAKARAQGISYQGKPLPKVAREIASFSFSGLKTAIALAARGLALQDEQVLLGFCRAIEESIVDALRYKTEKMVRQTGCQVLGVGGGVSANHYLAEQLRQIPGVAVVMSPPEFSTDNAGMIGWVAEQLLVRGVRASYEQEPLPGWRVEEALHR